MATKEMTLSEINARIERGDLVVYLDEEYGYRQWFWFPNMSESDLRDYWDKCNIEDHFFSPSGLPGDMVSVPTGTNFETIQELMDYEAKAHDDPRALCLVQARSKSSDVDREKLIADYDAWLHEYYPAEALWSNGFNSKSTWRSHTHMDDDSWLKKPSE